MLLRKINAGLSLISTFLLLNHAIFIALYIFSNGRILNPLHRASWLLVGIVAAHAAVSIAAAILSHAGAEKRTCKNYPKKNIPTLIQRASGMLLIPLIALHVAGASGAMTPPKLVHTILPPVFFLISLAHAALSASKAFITLGIGSAKVVRAIDVALKITCALTLVADVVGFYVLYGF